MKKKKVKERRVICYSNATNTKKLVGICHIYAHGKLESELNHDIIKVPIKDINNRSNATPFEPNHIHTIWVRHKMKWIKGVLIFWQSTTGCKGIVCKPGDTAAIDYAMAHFVIKSNSI